MNEIPQSEQDCINNSPETLAFLAKYGIDAKTDPSTIEKKLIAYATLHYLEVHKWMGGLNDDWKAAKYYKVGNDGAGYLHKALGITPAAIAQLRS